MPQLISLTGNRYGRLLVVEHAGPRTLPSGRVKHYWLCRCECGTEKEIVGDSLKRGLTRSCGCLHREIASPERQMSNHPEYRSYRSMLSRCCIPSAAGYEYYGGRGIEVCERWKESFWNFLEDMGERPEGMTLDRLDADGNYEPGNCQWACKRTQARNQFKLSDADLRFVKATKEPLVFIFNSEER